MFIESLEIKEIVAEIAQLPREANDITVILIGEETAISIPDLITELNAQDITFMGGFFPGIIVGNQQYASGIVVDVFPALSAPFIITGLENPDFSTEVLDKITAQVAQAETEQPTALIFVEAFTANIASLLSQMFQRLKNDVAYIGSGAGSGTFQQKPSIFDNSGLYQDAAVIGLLDINSKIGVRHGWDDLRGPFIANRTNKTIVYELGNKPAFEVYSRIIKMITKTTLTQENFFEIAKNYPLGIYHPGIDKIVRAPVAFTEDGGIVCVGEVPPRSLIYILRGNSDSLISHAQHATKDVLSGDEPLQHCLVVDCLARVLYLEDEFSKELDQVLQALPAGSKDPIGVLSLGEIGSYATGSVEFFNATIVVSGMGS